MAEKFNKRTFGKLSDKPIILKKVLPKKESPKIEQPKIQVVEEVFAVEIEILEPTNEVIIEQPIEEKPKKGRKSKKSE